MSAYIADKAIVLRTYKLKESDRIALLFTENNGKIKVVAKGARKGNSFSSRIQPGAIIDAQWYKKFELGTLTQALTIYLPHAKQSDYESIKARAIVCEVTDIVSQEGMLESEHKHIFTMLSNVLEIMQKYNVLNCASAYIWRLLLFSGMTPSISICGRCQIENDFKDDYFYDIDFGEFVCEKCVSEKYVKINIPNQNFLNLLENSKTLSALNISDTNPTELLELIVKLFEHITDIKIKSL